MPALDIGQGVGGVVLNGVHTVTVSLTPAATATITAVEQSLVVPALPAAIFQGNTPPGVTATPPSVTAGVSLVAARVIDSTHIGVTFMNPTAGSLTSPSGLYTFTIFW